MINQLLAQATLGQPTPTVGMGATTLHHSDRHAATIIEVQTVGKSVIVTTQDDNATCVEGSAHDGSARYEFTPNPRGRKRHFRFTDSDAFWQEVNKNPVTGRWIRVGGTSLRIGHRDHYYDPHF